MTTSHSAFMFSAATDRPDRAGRLSETARVVRSDRGLRVNGYLVATDTTGGNAFGSSYSVLCDPAGHLRRLTVQADSSAGERSLTLTRAPGGPWVVGRADGPQTEPALAGLEDVVLAGSLLSHTLPIARGGIHRDDGDGPTTRQVAVIDIPELTVSTETVTYRTLAVDPDGVSDVAVTSGDVDSSVLVGVDGFVAGAQSVLAR